MVPQKRRVAAADLSQTTSGDASTHFCMSNFHTAHNSTVGLAPSRCQTTITS